MEKKYILSFDQGTTSSRAILFDKSGNLVASSSKKHEQIYENSGWVSHNASEIYKNIVDLGKKVIAEACVNASEIAAIGITNQRETIVAWNKKTGEPVCDAIVWQCRRSANICKRIVNDGFADTIRNKTGLLVDPYFSATKIKWILETNLFAVELLYSGDLLVGTIDSFLIWNLTGGTHVTDYSNASRTMLFNIHTLNWDEEILDYFKIPKEILPSVVPSSGIVGETIKDIFGDNIPISGIAGDQHAALFGQTCLEEGEAKNTYGTGCFILQNIGNKALILQGNMLTTIAWNINGKTTYAVEGSIFSAGSVVEWLINELKLIQSVNEIEEICEGVKNTDGVYMVPAFTGLGAPYWDMYARAIICGMKLSTGKAHIVRAAIESIAYQTKDVLNFMEKETGIKIKRLNVDGGVSRNNFLMQFQADILNVLVERPQNIETTALGAAYLAGLAVKFWDSLEDVKKHRKIDIVFTPMLNKEHAERKYTLWQKAINLSKGWEN